LKERLDHDRKEQKERRNERNLKCDEDEDRFDGAEGFSATGGAGSRAGNPWKITGEYPQFSTYRKINSLTPFQEAEAEN
jgi:hypothetical protein